MGRGPAGLGSVHDPLRIDADASKPDYKVGEFSLHAEVPEVADAKGAANCSAGSTPSAGGWPSRQRRAQAHQVAGVRPAVVAPGGTGVRPDARSRCASASATA